MSQKKYRWIKIAESISEIPFRSNDIAEVDTPEKKICIGRHNDEYFAFAHKCPHAGGFLVDGWTDNMGNVICNLHRYKFCMKNGRNISGEGYHLKHWPIEIREDGVYVGFEINKLFGLF